ncbi:MAG: type VI secretion system membrane subunit TssM [Planctomycetes bacterium]|nr:type VI secretion system membrane subunit TssM [Planctomycetota bacterium]
MKSLLAALFKEGVISVVVLIILLALVWLGGEYFKTADNDLMKERIGISVVLLSLFAVLFIAQKVVAIRSAMRIEQQLKAQSGAQLQGAAADKKAEVEELRRKFDESLEALKRTKGGKSALFTLPWYVIIGPPGSGKTTALSESGLNFPAAQGNVKVRGIGGTRNCDWWFTEDGILLDTAGRYTTVAEDQAEWFAFLDMIKQGRKQKPINGAIVAVSVEDLLKATQGELDQIAKDVRNRLDELSARLQAVFPVYVMFTKCDLVPGFVEFFEDFTKDERNQVWGFTLPYSVPDRDYTEVFDAECGKMTAALEKRRLDLLASERPAAKKQPIYLFPRQFAIARGRMREFVAALFHAGAFRESAVLRGMYFCSGTQKGMPIDQILARIGAALGTPPAVQAADERVEKKSYFIHNLFTRVIFPDRVLARSSSQVLRKQRALRAGLQLGSLITLALGGYALVASFLTNREMTAQTEAAAVGVAETAGRKAPELEQLKALESLRAELAPLKRRQEQGVPLGMRFGMYQGDRLFEAGVQPYLQQLRPLYIEPAARRVKAELEQRLADLRNARTSEEYQQLLDLWRVYRMMGGEAMAPESEEGREARIASGVALVASVLKKSKRWTGTLGGSQAGELEELAGEQLEFYASLMPRAVAAPKAYSLHVATDRDLIQRVGLELKNAFWESVAYDSIIQRAGEKLEPLTLQALLAGDPNRNLLEVRPGEGEDPQKLLNAFTQEAWDSQVKQLIDERAADLSAMYRELEVEKKADELVQSLRERHKARHAQEWKRFFSCVYPTERSFATLQDARDAMRQLAGETSPYRTLFRNAWNRRALNLGPGERQGEAGEGEIKALEASMKALDELRKAVDEFVTATDRGNRVRSHMDNPKRLEALRDAINLCTRAVRDAFPKDAEGGAEVLNRVVDAVFGALRTECVGELEGDWYSGIASSWDTLANHFPFVEDAKTGMAMAEFSAHFNPKSGSIWQADRLFRAVQALRFNDRPLFVFKAEYEDTIKAAALIRDAMFDGPGDEKVKVRFSVTLVQRGLLRSSSIQVGANAEGQAQVLKWNDNRDQSKDFVWAQPEGTRAKAGGKVTVTYGEQQQVTLEKGNVDDDWGLLRLLRDGSLSGPLTNSDGKQYFCRWEFTARDSSIFRLEAFLQAAKPVNPFQPGLFTKFTMAKGMSQ